MNEKLKELTDAGWNVELKFHNSQWTCYLIPTRNMNYSHAPAGRSPDPLTAVNLAHKDALTRKISP